ncbi:MAG: hypothetical protein AAFO99_12290 [Bacteroidota bacterium]
MNKSYKLYRIVSAVLCLLTLTVYGQQSKTYQETFNVGNEAVLDINTSHTDIEFETWNKNQVAIEAEITLEGASEEEAKAYFKESGIEIVGNSKTIEIRTRGRSSWVFDSNDLGSFHNLEISIPDLPNVEPLFLDLHIPDLPLIPEMPPMPPMPIQNFDYSKYKKEGEKYLEEWKKEFDKSFNDEYKERMEDWSERLKERAEKRNEEMNKRNEEREERLKERAERMEERKRVMEERKKMLKERKEEMEELRKQQRRVFISGDDDSPHIFYRSSEGKNKNYKIKKTIKIKMPKSTKLKMNVRHGEVKLAEHTRNLNATLSYTSLLATTIDGGNTIVRASYSPVSVQKWNYGQLKTDYSDAVNLQEVSNLRLNAVSSNVTIDKLLKSAYVKNNFGELTINSISENFTDMHVTVQNGELICVLPKTPFVISVNGTSSQFSCPESLTLNKTKNHNKVLHKGYNISRNNGKSIVINSKYSDVVLER